MNILTQCTFNDGIVGDGYPSRVHLGVTTLINEIVDALHVRIPPCHVWINDSQHL